MGCELSSTETTGQELWDEGIVAIGVSEQVPTRDMLGSYCRTSTYSMPEIICSYSSHHGTLARSLARAMMASFFDVAGSIFVDRFVIYVEKRLWET